MPKTNGRSPGGGRTRHRPEAARRMIAEAAVEFLWERPFRDLTVNLLMARTPLSRTAFYQYYDDLYELMETLLGGVRKKISEASNHWFEGRGPALPALREALEEVVRIAREEGPILRAVTEAAPMDPRIERLLAEFNGGFAESARLRIERDQRAGIAPRVDAGSVARGLIAFINRYTVDLFGRKPQAKLGPATEVIFRIWSASIYAPAELRVSRRPKRARKADRESLKEGNTSAHA